MDQTYGSFLLLKIDENSLRHQGAPAPSFVLGLWYPFSACPYQIAFGLGFVG